MLWPIFPTSSTARVVDAARNSEHEKWSISQAIGSLYDEPRCFILLFRSGHLRRTRSALTDPVRTGSTKRPFNSQYNSPALPICKQTQSTCRLYRSSQSQPFVAQPHRLRLLHSHSLITKSKYGKTELPSSGVNAVAMAADEEGG